MRVPCSSDPVEVGQGRDRSANQSRSCSSGGLPSPRRTEPAQSEVHEAKVRTAGTGQLLDVLAWKYDVPEVIHVHQWAEE